MEIQPLVKAAEIEYDQRDQTENGQDDPQGIQERECEENAAQEQKSTR